MPKTRRLSIVLAAALPAATALWVPPAGAAAPTLAASSAPKVESDFNGDGYSDLAIGVPGESYGGTSGRTYAHAGAVQVVYGGADGLTARGAQLWSLASPGVLGVPGRERRPTDVGQGLRTWDLFGSSLATGDFDADGYADLAIAAPYKDTRHGSVNVLYGSANGLTAEGDQLFDKDDAALAIGRAQGFGRGLVVGDFDGDGADDLVVNSGIPYGTSVHMLYGQAETGLSLSRLQVYRHNIDGLATGDFNADGADDLALGLPISGRGGEVEIYSGQLGTGLNLDLSTVWSQATAGIAGSSEQGDNFGQSLAAGDVNGDGHDDLAIGVPYESLGRVSRGGGVHVLRGSATGITAAGSQWLTQDTPGVGGTAEAEDEFGLQLLLADLGRDGRAELVVGVPHESVGSIRRAGLIHVFYGAASGVTTAGNQLWSHDSPGVKGMSGYYAFFGASLTAGNFNGSGGPDLAVGAPWGPTSGRTGANVGTVTVLLSVNGRVSDADQLWHQNVAGIPGTAETDDTFGVALGTRDSWSHVEPWPLCC